MPRTSRSCTRPTSTTPAACPTTGAATSTTCRTCPPSTAATAATSRMRRWSNRSRSAPRPTPSRCKASEADLAVARKQVHVQSADRGLPLPRQPLGRPRPAQAHRAPEDPRTRTGVLRPDRVRHGHHVLGRRTRTSRKAENMTPARDRAGAARDLLRHDRRRVHALHRPGREALVAGAARIACAASRTSAPTRRSTSSTA